MHIPPAAFLRVNPAGAARHHRAGLDRPRPWTRDRKRPARKRVGRGGKAARGGTPPASNRGLPAARRGSAGVGVGDNHLRGTAASRARPPNAGAPAPSAPGHLSTPATSPQTFRAAGRVREPPPPPSPRGGERRERAAAPRREGCRPTDRPAGQPDKDTFVCELAAGPASGGAGDLGAGNAPREKAVLPLLPCPDSWRCRESFPFPSIQVPLTLLHILVNSR